MYRGITGGIEALVHLIYAQDNCSNIAYRVYDNDELIINRVINGLSNKRNDRCENSTAAIALSVCDRFSLNPQFA